MSIDVDDINQALDRIARTADGEMLYRYLQRECLTFPNESDPSDGALRANHGRRSFAADLMRRLEKGIDESVGASRSTSGQRPTERAVVFRAPSYAGPRRVSARDHIAAHDPELSPGPGSKPAA